MANIIISLFMVVLVGVCALMTIIILMQKPSANAGMGAALGGGAAESVFGGETANVLLKYTVRIAVAFFLLSFLLYLGFVVQHRAAPAPVLDLPTVAVEKSDKAASPLYPPSAASLATQAALPTPNPAAASTPPAASTLATSSADGSAK